LFRFVATTVSRDPPVRAELANTPKQSERHKAAKTHSTDFGVLGNRAQTTDGPGKRHSLDGIRRRPEAVVDVLPVLVEIRVPGSALGQELPEPEEERDLRRRDQLWTQRILAVPEIACDLSRQTLFGANVMLMFKPLEDRVALDDLAEMVAPPEPIGVIGWRL